MSRFSRWRESRRRCDERAVIKAIRMLRPSQASGVPIYRLSGIPETRARVALIRLEQDEAVTSTWVDGPYPRRRLYRLAPAAAPA